MSEHKCGTCGHAKNVGEVLIADEVVSAIAGLAALEVDGVIGIAGKFSDSFSTKSNYEKVKIRVEGVYVYVNMSINVKYGYSIPKVTKQIQERVIASLKNMVGLTCKEVNIKIVKVSGQNG